MDPNSLGPEEYGQDYGRDIGQDIELFGDDTGRRRAAREPVSTESGHQTPQQSRMVQLITGDFLLTVNPVDGSEIEPCPPGKQPAAPVRRTTAERADLERATAPPVPTGPPGPQLPLLERQEERERLVRLLARGRSVRLTGPAGSGRTTLMEIVAADCADLAPDGVVKLSGYKRTATDLLYALCGAVYRAPLHRPDREGLLALVHGIGAVVILDDLEFGGDALEELLDATPECAFLLGTTPDVAAHSAESHLEEVFLAGLGRNASIELLEKVVERPLTDDEANWSGDLWFESEGLPLRFVQAGALLRQRDRLRTPKAYDAFGHAAGQPADAYPGDVPFEEAPFEDAPFGDAPFEDIDAVDVPLPSLGEGAAPATLLASRLTEAARATLRFAVALGGEVPHQAHLPAMVGDTHADAALGELANCGLLSPAGSRYRLAAGVLAQLEAGGYGDDAVVHARTAAQHYAWWTGHPSVTPERAAAEADAVLAAMVHLVPGDEAGRASAAVLLARSAAPAFAAGLHWGAWEKALRTGQEAARIAGEVAEEAYFHHELGVLALCVGHLDRARAELEASIGMRGVLADKSGAVAGRRALALVTDRSGGPLPGGRIPAGQEAPAARPEESASPPGGVPAVVPLFPRQTEEPATMISRSPAPMGTARKGPFGGGPAILRGARRNLVAVGAGALLAAVLGTVVTLGATSGSEDPEGQNVTTEQSADEDGESESPADEPTDVPAPADPSDGTHVSPSASGRATTPGSASPSPGATASDATRTTDAPTSGDSSTPGDPSASESGSVPTSPSSTATETETPTETPTDSEPPPPSPTQSETETTGEPSESDSASGPTGPGTSSESASASATNAGPSPSEPSDGTATMA